MTYRSSTPRAGWWHRRGCTGLSPFALVVIGSLLSWLLVLMAIAAWAGAR